jgi:hypothetical protein
VKITSFGADFPAQNSDMACRQFCFLTLRYYGSCSVAIKWLRIETPQSRKLFRGIFDTSLAGRVSYILDTLYARRAVPKWSKVKLTP